MDTTVTKSRPQPVGQSKSVEQVKPSVQTQGAGAGENVPKSSELNLAALERTVRLKFGGKTARHIFRRLTFSDWWGFLKDSRTEMILQGDSWSHESRTDEAAIALWDRAIVRVEGYRVGEDWKEKMPASHKIAAVGLLQEVVAVPSSEEDDLDLEADRRTVTLKAAWNGQVFHRLQHIFRVPEQEQTLTYRRLMAEFFRKSSRRQSTTRVVVPVRLSGLVKLYDRLIEEAEGYTGFRAPREMDPLHKQAAVLALFDSPQEESEEEPAADDAVSRNGGF